MTPWPPGRAARVHGIDFAVLMPHGNSRAARTETQAFCSGQDGLRPAALSYMWCRARRHHEVWWTGARRDHRTAAPLPQCTGGV
jgi:hypothetical protein